MTEPFTIAGTVTGPELPGPRLGGGAIAYAQNVRRISRATLERLGVVSGTVLFPQLNRSSEAVFFPYRRHGEVINWKAAAFPEKAFTSKKGGELAFFNLETVLAAGPEEVFITEGEWDAAALVELGVPHTQVLSVPNGARTTKKDDGRPRGYDYVDAALAAGLCKVKRFVWCGDSDTPGHSLRQDMANLIGPARFYYVEWPEGCKDANDYLRSDGPEAVLSLVTEGVQDWQIDGVYTLDELEEVPALKCWDIGFPEFGDRIKLAPGTLSVVTGHPGHGKTTLWMQIWHNVVTAYYQKAYIVSFETRAKPHHRRTLRQLFHGKLERDMSDAEMKRADDYINRHFLWGQHPENQATLEWVLDRAEYAVVKRGASIVQIDPWNRLEGNRGPNETETEYIGRCLRALHTFAQTRRCHVQILAHPAKMSGDRRGRPPELEDISGSKNWDNMVDQGFAVHRPVLFAGGVRQTSCQLFHRKARFEELGYPCRLDLNLDLSQGHYVPDLGGDDET